ncbi:MAG: tripartite tricarboxylate transporter substrate binding protein [Curvibacter lanceolatus]|uniref:Bug family tripartite tricarboxylate transporter substrate binding protein n=1 Tax=Curvibacter lanceolatus TaxID=86182 RepID=UPI002352FD13|nr:tripartite tricarboxylate transporter substrate binding protein [Curvibacter lanceolatus]MBV5294338.1 tripartite tricarboxylate transporter substrate binding protein [Curvibacter lanceolatus]
MNHAHASLPRRQWLLACAGALASGATWADGRVVSLIVPYPAGGGSDIVARQLQPELGRRLGETVIVENLAGASGAIGTQHVVSAAADGHTLLAGSPMEIMLTPLGMAAARYKPEDLQPVGQFAVTTMVLLVRSNLGVNSVDELLQLARKPGAKELSYGSIGPGSLYHLLGERFTQLARLKTLHVPYKGMAPLVQDLISGQFDFAFVPLAGNIPDVIESGRVKALALAASQKHTKLSSLPLMKDVKGFEDFVYGLWSGLQVPRSTPEPLQQKLHQICNEILAVPEVRRTIEAGGSSVAPPMELAALRASYAADIDKYRAIAKAINLQPQ